MLVSQTTYDIKTGKTTTQMVDIPGILTDAEAAAVTAQVAQQDANDKNLRDQALTALDNLRAYRDNASPNNAATIAVVKTLCRCMIGLIRLYLRKFDATD